MSDWNTIGYDDLIKNYFSPDPKDVKGLSISTMYYRHYLLTVILGAYEVTGAPESWDMPYLLTTLYTDGHFTITDTPLGILPLQCGFTGINVFNHPTDVQVANPVLGSFTRKIGEDCALVTLDYTFGGIMPLIDRFAVMLSMCDSAIAVNLMNSKVSFIGLCSSKAQAASMKKMYDMLSKGEPAVFVRGDQINQDTFFFNRAKENYVANDIQETKRNIVNEFLTRIGIRNANRFKRERLNTDEVNSNNDEVYINGECWVKTVNEGLREANRLFGLNLSYRRVVDYEPSEPDNILE